MSTITTERIVVGKLTLDAEDGQLSIFALPEDFAWLKHFSARHMAEFFTELLDALQHGQQTGDWVAVSDVIESWKATANIEADPIVSESVDEGLLELKDGHGVSWSTLRQELDL
jgi:hypothetical protein